MNLKNAGFWFIDFYNFWVCFLYYIKYLNIILNDYFYNNFLCLEATGVNKYIKIIII